MEGAYLARHKDGSIYYRSSVTRRGVKISLGGFSTAEAASLAAREAVSIYDDPGIVLGNVRQRLHALSWEKAVSVINHRDNGIYVKTPVYLRNGYFSYFLPDGRELKFDTDDLFYYSSHRILARDGGSLYVNEYGMQTRILSRYGIRNYAVEGKDYYFVNHDPTDLRSANIVVLSRYHGVHPVMAAGVPFYEARIHLNGDWKLGRFRTENEAAVAYNKAADLLRQSGFRREWPENYIEDLKPSDYADLYVAIELPERFMTMAETAGKTGQTVRTPEKTKSDETEIAQGCSDRLH